MRVCVNRVEYVTRQERPFLFLFGWSEEKERVVIKVDDFRPYCYVKKRDYISGRVPRVYITASEICREKLLTSSDELIKIFTRNPTDIKRLRNNSLQRKVATYESDIPFTRRYMIDSGIHKFIELDLEKRRFRPVNNGKSLFKVLYFDIEVPAGEEGIDTLMEEKKRPIVVISYVDNWERKVRTLKLTDFKSEKQMLRKFIQEIDRIDPDIITGFNVENFDLPYLVERCRKLKVPYVRALSPLRFVRRDEEGRWTVKGRTVLDYSRIYREWVGRELRSSWNEALGEILKRHSVPVEKIEIEGTFEETWKKNPEKLVKRCENDVKGLLELEEILGIFDFFDEVRGVTGSQWEDVFHKSTLVDIVLLRLAKEKGKVLENKPKKEEEEDRYEGAYVREPEVGIFENVVLVDFSGFYPSLIILYNISPETYDHDGDLRIENYSFVSKPKGLLPQAVEKVKRLKESLKRKMRKSTGEEYQRLKTKHEAVKRVLNSFYGATRHNLRARMPWIAESITAAGRKHIKEFIEKVESEGVRVLYADTDSAFLYAPEKQYEEIVSLVEKNSPPGLLLEAQTVFKRIFFLTKKRYAGIDSEGRVWKKGIQFVRSDSEEFLAGTQELLSQAILQKKEPKEIVSLVLERYEKLKKLSFSSLMDLGRPVQVKKPPSEYIPSRKPAHLRAIEASNTLFKTRFGKGSKPVIVRVRPCREFGYVNWIALNEALEKKIRKKLKKRVDVDFYKKRFANIVDELLKLIDKPFESIRDGQTSLFMYLGEEKNLENKTKDDGKEG